LTYRAETLALSLVYVTRILTEARRHAQRHDDSDEAAYECIVPKLFHLIPPLLTLPPTSDTPGNDELRAANFAHSCGRRQQTISFTFISKRGD
jgi:hypothetical protein